MKLQHFSACLFVLLVSCQSKKPGDITNSKDFKKSSESCIKPIKGLEIPIRTFEISSNQKSVIELPNGGSILIPENAFESIEGKPLKGKVEIQWQEFHSLSDIALSGIPMKYDSSNCQSDLISGGMFTIDGKQGNAFVKLAPGKKILVNLSSTNSQKDFNFYSLNTKSGKWKYKGKGTGKPTNDLVNTLNSSKKTKLEKDPITLDIKPKIDPITFPELAKEDILGWEIESDKLSKKEINQLRQEVVTAEITSCDKAGKYRLSMQNKHISKDVTARPITFDHPPSTSSKANLENKTMQNELNDFQNLAISGGLIRTMEIPNFGTYNWDCMYKEPAIEAKIELDIPNSSSEKYATFFFVSPKDKRIIPINFKDKILLSKIVPACIIAISKTKEVFTVRNKDLNKIRGNSGRVKYQFEMTKISEPIKSGQELSELIDKCI